MLAVPEAIDAVKSGDRPVWLDMQVHDREAAKHVLQDVLGFHELAVEDALSTNERPTLQEFKDALFLVVPAFVKNGADVFEEVAFFMRRNALVTVTLGPVPPLDKWFERWTDRPERVGTHPAFLLHLLIDAIVDDYFPALEYLEDAIDDLGDRIFAGDTTQVKDLLHFKKKLLELRRRLTPIRDVLNALQRHDLIAIPAEVRPYLQDVYDHVVRLTELAEINRETVASFLDVHLSTVSNNLNIVVKKMTVVSTVLMVMAIVSGIYGMNFDHMPELHWANGYYFALTLMAVLAGLVVVVFKVIRWI